jgi:hypothetical protein
MFDDDMSYDMACHAIAKTKVECQLTCKKNFITYWQVYFIRVDFFACQMGKHALHQTQVWLTKGADICW